MSYEEAHRQSCRDFNHLPYPYDQTHGIYDQTHSAETVIKYLYVIVLIGINRPGCQLRQHRNMVGFGFGLFIGNGMDLFTLSMFLPINPARLCVLQRK